MGFSRIIPFSLIVFVCSAFIYATEPVQAASPGFTVSPIRSTVEVSPGATYAGAFTLANQSALPLPLEATVRVFGVQDDIGTIDIGDVQGLASEENADAWIALSEAQLLLDAYETRRVPYTIAIPASAPYGTYALAVIFQAKLPSADADSPLAQLLPAIGALFFVDVIPQEGEEPGAGGVIELSEFIIPEADKIRLGTFGASLIDIFGTAFFPLEFVERTPLAFSIRLKNLGPYAARPNGKLTLVSWSGSAIAEAPFPGGAILPGTERQYSVTIPGPLRLSRFSWLPAVFRHSFLPGRHTARIDLAAGIPAGGQLAVAGALVFWAFPRLLMLSTVAALMLLTFVVLYRRRIVRATRVFFQPKADPPSAEKGFV